MSKVELNKELRKAGVAVYSEKSHGSTRVGPVHSSRRKSSSTQNAGIEIFEYKDGSGYSVRYENGWKNTKKMYNEIEIQEFINKTIEILKAHNVGRIDVKAAK
jgi:hypothetical protein